MHQGRDENRSLEETLTRAWRALAALQRREPTMLPRRGAGRLLPRRRRHYGRWARRRGAGYRGGGDRGAVSPRRLAVPPGRAGRLWLTRRLAVARRGADLLDRKLQVLRRELDRRRDSAARAAAEWEHRRADADGWLLRAALLGGERAIRLAAADTFAEVMISHAATMGVRYPADATCATPPPVGRDGPPSPQRVRHTVPRSPRPSSMPRRPRRSGP